MRKIGLVCLCVFCIGCLAACGKTAPSEEPASFGAYGDEAFTLPADSETVTAVETMDEADVTCVPLDRDGRIIGFEMRFLQSAKLDTLFSDQENMYYGSVDCGKTPIGVPMEQIRILTDEQTREFVLTLLLPSGEKLSGKTCTVTFYTAKRSNPIGNALFCARKEISLSSSL